MSRVLFLIFLLVSSCINYSTQELPGSLKGKVIAVKDGDTIVILFDGKPLTIRFEHIDCPDLKKRQPFGKAAKRFISDLSFGPVVLVLNKLNLTGIRG